MATAKYPKIELREFKDGLRVGVPDRLYKPNESPACWNVSFSDPKAAITKRMGYQLKHTTSMDGSGSPVTWMTQFFNSQGADFFLGFTCASAGAGSASVFHWNSATDSWTHMGASAVGSAWSPVYTHPILTETFADQVMAINQAGDSPIYFSGGMASWEMMPVSAAAGYTFRNTFTSQGNAISACVPCQSMKGYKNYLFIANTTEGGIVHNSRVRWSDLEDPFAWPSANYIDLDPNDGDYIVGMEVLGDHLIVFKERKIYAIDYIGGIYLFDSELRVEGRGCVAGQSITSVYNDLIFAAEDGIYAFTGHDIEETSYDIKDMILDINATNRNLIQSAPMEEEDQLWFVAPSGDSAINNIAFVYDYDQECWTVNSINAASLGFYYVVGDLTLGDLADSWDSYSMAWDDRSNLANTSIMCLGTYNGFVGDLGFSTSDGVSGDIVGVYKTPWLDMGDPARTKRIMRIIFYLMDEGTSTYGLTWNLRTDYNPNMTPVASGVISLSGTTAGDMKVERLDITQQARAFQLEIRTNNRGEPWTLYEIHIEYTNKGTPKIDSKLA